MHRHTRSGITLVELLVVVAVVGVLLAILVPAVHTARAQARRASCANNLRQLGLALRNYESALGSLPLSTVYGEGRGSGHSGFFLVLLFLEQANLYNLLSAHLVRDFFEFRPRQQHLWTRF
jgi:prepilin-type N-terminal cleavage/methylation domain-containing protein